MITLNSKVNIPVDGDPGRLFDASINWWASNISENNGIYSFSFGGSLQIFCCWPRHQGFNFKGNPTLEDLKGDHKSPHYNEIVNKLISEGLKAPSKEDLMKDWCRRAGIKNYIIHKNQVEEL